MKEYKFLIKSGPEVGRKIHCIKAIREFSGIGLKEAKDIADSFHYSDNTVALHKFFVTPEPGKNIYQHDIDVFIWNMRQQNYVIEYLSTPKDELEDVLFRALELAAKTRDINKVKAIVEAIEPTMHIHRGPFA